MTTSELLIKAKELLVREGWVKYLLRGDLYAANTPHCALGAIFDARGMLSIWRLQSASYDQENIAAIRFLLAAIPGTKDHNVFFDDGIVANYNNSRTSFAEIESWFDRAIELAQAAEMYQELETAKALDEVKEADYELELVRA